jgi:hypothetical protein
MTQAEALAHLRLLYGEDADWDELEGYLRSYQTADLTDADWQIVVALIQRARPPSRSALPPIHTLDPAGGRAGKADA